VTTLPPHDGRRRSLRRPGALIRGLLAGRGQAAGIDLRMLRLWNEPRLRLTAPTPDEAGDRIVAKADELARSEAVDHGSHDVFEPTVGSWQGQWDNKLTVDHYRYQDVLTQYQEEARSVVARHELRVAVLEQQLAQIDRQIAVLDGPERMSLPPAAGPGQPPAH
jgi:hypothetical protein